MAFSFFESKEKKVRKLIDEGKIEAYLGYDGKKVLVYGTYENIIRMLTNIVRENGLKDTDLLHISRQHRLVKDISSIYLNTYTGEGVIFGKKCTVRESRAIVNALGLRDGMDYFDDKIISTLMGDAYEEVV